MDDFAQTRPPDDLFESEIAPPPPQLRQPEPEPQQQQQSHISYGPQGSKWENAPDVPTGPREPSRGRGRGRGEGRGRGRGGRGGRGRGGHRGKGQPNNNDDYNRNIPLTADLDPSAPPDVASAPPTDNLDSVEPTTPAPSQNDVPEGTPTGPASGGPGAEVKLDRNKKVDRLASGGFKKPKLTPEELEAKMANAKLRNQKLIEKRLAAEEDERRFQQEEEERKKEDAVLKEKLRVQREQQEKAQKELNAERERNRQRKMKSATGRDWDSEKKEDDFKPESRRAYGRGAHGSFVTEHLGDTPPPRNFDSRRVDYGDRPPRGPRGDSSGFDSERRGRGRGRGRGGRGGRGGHRGGYDGPVEGHREPQQQQQQQKKFESKPEEFPALPGNAKKTDEAKAKETAPLTPIKGSWADDAESELHQKKGGEELPWGTVVKGVKELKVEEKKDEGGKVEEKKEMPKVEKAEKMNWADEVDDAT